MFFRSILTSELSRLTNERDLLSQQIVNDAQHFEDLLNEGKLREGRLQSQLCRCVSENETLKQVRCVLLSI